MRPLILALSSLVLLALVGCRDPQRRDDERPVQAVTPYRLLVLLDPTVADAAWGVDVIANLMGRIGENSQVIVWTVTTGAIADSHHDDLWVQFDPKKRLLDLSEVATFRQQLAATFKQRWDALHGDAVHGRIPRSCILTSLYQASRSLEDRQDTEAFDTDLVIASDLLEACGDWGPPVNLERGLLAAKTLVPPHGKTGISLAGVKRVWAVRANSPVVDTPLEAEHLRGLWTSALTGLGAISPKVVDDPTAITLTRQRPRPREE
jgi:hypothetical protein